MSNVPMLLGVYIYNSDTWYNGSDQNRRVIEVHLKWPIIIGCHRVECLCCSGINALQNLIVPIHMTVKCSFVSCEQY